MEGDAMNKSTTHTPHITQVNVAVLGHRFTAGCHGCTWTAGGRFVEAGDAMAVAMVHVREAGMSEMTPDTHDCLYRAARDALAADLAAANARIAELEVDRDWEEAQKDAMRAAGDRTFAKLTAENAALRDRITELEGKCVCGPWHPGTDGELEDCPVHGRAYAEWVDRAKEAEARIDKALGIYAFLMRNYANPEADAETVLATARVGLRAALAADTPTTATAEGSDTDG